MDTFLQMLMTVIAAFAFLLLIAKISSAVINGGLDHPQSKIVHDELKSSKNSKKKSTKKVRFAIIDHDEFVVNKTVVDSSETKSIVFENKNCNEIEDYCGNETDVDSVKDEPVSNCTDSLLDEGMLICEENVDKYCNEKQVCMSMRLLCDDGIDEAEKEKQGLISEEDDSSDDDWEGIERSDLEKVFALAADYRKANDNLQSLESDVQMQLYALHKVATEGPCHEAQPMALKVNARAKWNSWQKLGNMNPDVAMEQYITLLSELDPGWSQGIHSVDKH